MRPLITSILLLLSLSLFAQDYNEGFGVRVGVRSGVVYRNYFDEENSVQAMLTFQRGGAQFVFVKQFYQPIMLGITEKVFFYYGFGGHVGYASQSNRVYEINGDLYRRKELSGCLGIDANLGIEYHVIKYPLVFSIDYQPFYELSVPLFFRKNFADVALVLFYNF